MTDTDKLKRLAEALRGCLHITEEEHEAILALIAENERLRALVSLGNKAILREGLDADRYQRQRDEAVALLHDAKTYVSIAASKDSDMSYNPARELRDGITKFVARVDAKQQG